MAAVDAVGVPRFALLHGTEEHLIQAQGVGAVTLHDHVGVHDVEHRLRHLFHSSVADILAVLQYKLGVLILGTPFLERLDVEHVGRHDVHVDVDGGGVILVLETEAHEHGCLRVVVVVYAEHEVASSLDHALVDEFLERLLLAAHAEVEEHLVPEARIDKVACGVLAATDIEVYVLPVFVGSFRHQCRVVVGVHVAQIVGR